MLNPLTHLHQDLLFRTLLSKSFFKIILNTPVGQQTRFSISSFAEETVAMWHFLSILNADVMLLFRFKAFLDNSMADLFELLC